jgi:hypothetical protein
MAPETDELLRLWRTPKRLKRGEKNPSIDWALAERLYVEGDLEGEAEHTRRVYPSRAVIARRAGTTQGNLAQRSARYKWADKREKFQIENNIIPPLSDDSLVVVPPNVGHARRRTKSASAGIAGARETLLAYIGLFRDAVEKRTLKHDSVHDLDKAVRLLAFVEGRADSIKATHTTVTLEVMQARHRQAREMVAHKVDDEAAGVIADAEYEETEPEPEPERSPRASLPPAPGVDGVVAA